MNISLTSLALILPPNNDAVNQFLEDNEPLIYCAQTSLFSVELLDNKVKLEYTATIGIYGSIEPLYSVASDVITMVK